MNLFNENIPEPQHNYDREPISTTFFAKNHRYDIKEILSQEAVDEAIKEINKDDDHALFIDTETTGLDRKKDKAFAIVIGKNKPKEFPIWHIDFRSPIGDYAKRKLSKVLVNKSKTTYFFNFKFDIRMLKNAGVDFDTQIVCVQKIADQILPKSDKKSLRKLALRFTKTEDGYETLKSNLDITDKNRFKTNHFEKQVSSIADKFCAKYGISRKEYPYTHIPLKVFVLYSSFDIIQTHVVADSLINKSIFRENQMFTPYFQIECSFNKPEIEIEEKGIHFNRNLCMKVISDFEKKLNNANLTDKIDINSNEQIFNYFKEEYNESTAKHLFPHTTPKSNKPRVRDEDIYQINWEEYPDAKKLWHYRKMEKYKSAYFEKFMNLQIDGYLYPTVNHLITGRISMDDPALQTLPNPNNQYAKLIRKLFTPPSDEFAIVSFDWSQQEPRSLAQLSQDNKLVEIYKDKDSDLYLTALEHYLKEMRGRNEKVDRDTKIYIRGKELNGRKVFKQLVLAKQYGMGKQKLAVQLGLTDKTLDEVYNDDDFYETEAYQEAKQLHEFMDELFPQVKEFHMERKDFMEKYGYVLTFHRRPCLLPSGDNPYTRSINYSIQGTGADIFKSASGRIYKNLRKCKSRICMMLHDEIIFYIHKDELSQLKMIKNEMEYVPPTKDGKSFEIPMSVDFGYSVENWGDIEEYDGPLESMMIELNRELTNE